MSGIIYDRDNVFAKIISGEQSVNIVYEDENVLAFHDIAPKADIHVLVIPKGEYVDYSHFVSLAPSDEVVNFFKKVKKIAVDCLELHSGYRIVTNIGHNAGQIVYHFHIHILGGTNLDEF